MAGNFSESTSGSGPTEMLNSWNWPGLIWPPDQMISDTASVIVLPSSSVTGVANGVLFTSAV